LTTRSERILVAEDNEVFAKALRFNLEHFGFSPTFARDGKEALQLAQETQFDLVITDYQMPKMLGMELCRALRADERYANTPLILMSAFEDRKVVELFDDLELLDAIFVKPFSMGELLTRIEACLAAANSDKPVSPS